MNEVQMPRTLSSLPVTVRAQSIADLPDPDLVAALVDEAAAIAGPRTVRALLDADPDAELDLWLVDGGATCWVGSRVLAKIPHPTPPKEAE